MRYSSFLIYPLLLVSYEIATYLSNDMYLPALPQIVIDLKTNHTLAQTTLTSWFLGSASMQLILGPVSDRYGRRPVLLTGGLVFLITTVICATTSNIHSLIITRFFQGMTVCSVVVAGYSSIHESFEHHDAIKVLALMGSITVLAPAFGPLMGAVIIEITNWRFIFWFQFILAFIALSALFFYMPESNPHGKDHPIELKKLFRTYWLIIKNKDFTLNTLAFCLLFAGMIAWIVVGPFLVIQDFNKPVIFFGIAQAFVFGCFIIGTHFVKRLIEKVAAKKLIFIGLVITIIGCLFALIITLVFSRWLPGFILALMIYAFGSGLAFAPLHRTAIEACKEPMGSRMAMFSAWMGFFGVLGSVLISLFYDKSLNSLAFILASIGLLASGTYFFKYFKSRPSD